MSHSCSDGIMMNWMVTVNNLFMAGAREMTIGLKQKQNADSDAKQNHPLVKICFRLGILG